jgi:hypothetical protein
VHRTDTGGHAAAQQADFLQWRLRIDFRQGNLSHHRIFAKRTGPHVVINRLTIVGETGGAIWHQAFALSGANGLTKIRFTGFTELTLTTFCGVQRNNMIAGFQAGHPFADFHNNATAFVTEYRREYAFRIIT